MTSRVLLSTDIGSDPDDALSLLTIFNSGINLEGIVTVNGNLEARCCIAKHMVNLSGRKIPVAKGESQPLGLGVSPYTNFEDCLVDSSFINEDETDEKGNLRTKPLPQVGVITKGVEFLARKLSKRSYTLFSIAPLTNLARLLEQYPKAAKNIERVYVMGCRFNSGGLEHNIRYDLKAAEMVFQSELPLLVIPGDVCEKYRLPDSFLEPMQSPAAQYVKHMTKAYLGLATAMALTTRQVMNTSFPQAIMDYVHLPHQAYDGLSFEERTKLSRKKSQLLCELSDAYFPLFEPEKYFERYSALVEHLEDPRLNFKLGTIVAEELKKIRAKSLSVADVFVPYCFLHPERIQTKRGTVHFTPRSESLLEAGEKHEIVTMIDYHHFEEFLREYLK